MPATTISPFGFSSLPEICFGAGALAQLPQRISSPARPARHVLLVTGSASFRASAAYAELTQALSQAGIRWAQVAVSGEPSPDFVDETVNRYRDEVPDWVVGIGGGSAMDAGKAISAMLLQTGSVEDFLEGRETRPHDGRKVPYVAVPTSSGTGTEATKNAVLSRIGPNGFKNSLRHDRFVPDIALIDPQLMLSCPPDLTAACGLDALTQLLESYVSTKASPLSDALALSGLEHVAAGFMPAYTQGNRDLAARGHMAYAAFLSGVVLANAGLGVVHGLAGPIGGYFEIPHGVVCGTLLAEATQANLDVLFEDTERHRVALEKFARAGATLSGTTPGDLREDCARLVVTLRNWIEQTGIPTLGHYGVTQGDLGRILDKSNNKNSPVILDRNRMQAILEARL